MTSHRTQVLPLVGPKYVATCSCGYIGTDRKDRTDAALEANQHVVDSRRAETKTAR